MEFRLLGPVAVYLAGRPIPIGGPTQRAALALMLLRPGQVVTAAQLIDALWSEEPPRTALQTVRAYVSRLRHALAAEADPQPRLRSEGPGYLIRVESGELDARTFEIAALAGRRLVARGDWAAAADELRAGLALWHGPALAGLERFPALAAEATRLEELKREALADRIDADLALGRHADVMPELERLTAEDPYRERAWGQLMLALYRSGRQTDALGAYRRARELLVDELGLDPGPELRSLQLAILRQDPSLQPMPPADPGRRLPTERNSFVGRSGELAHLDRLMVESRMVTLTGVGGSGKTRLALRATEDAARRYPDGVWWVELATVNEPDLVAQQAAATLGVSAAESRRRGAGDVLVDYLAEREALLVLDNCEHLVAAVAALGDAVLRRCPHMRVLATSRERLGVAGEVTVPVLPLEVPPENSDTPERYASVRLFLDRAMAVSHGFTPDTEDLSRIAEICRRVAGIPLAVELAAARVNVLSPAEIATRLEGHLDLVAGGPRTALPRHRSLRATLDWSYELLDPREQTLLRRISTFAAGFTVDAAAEVAGDGRRDSDSTIDELAGLIDRSLLQTSRRGPSLRYHLLEPIRQYAAEQLEHEEDADGIRARHAAYFLGLAERGDAHLRGPEQGAWLDRLDAEHANLRAAISWALGTGRTDLALQLIAALGWYWFMRGHWAEARRWLDRALEAPGGSDLQRARAIYRTGAIEIIRVNVTRMPALMEEALATCRREGDAHGVAWCIHLIGHAEMYRAEEPERALRLLTEAMERFHDLGDDWGEAWAMRYVASMLDDDPHRAIALGREVIQRFRSLGDTWNTAFSHYGLGMTLLTIDRVAEARTAFTNGRDLCRILDDEVMAAHNERGLGLAALIGGDDDEAERVLSMARAALLRAGDENCYALCSGSLGIIQLHRGDARAAREELQQALAGHRSIGRRDGVRVTLAWLAVAALAAGEPARAALLFGASGWRDVMKRTVVHPALRAEVAAATRATRRELGGAAYDRAVDKGRRMQLEEAVRFAVGNG